MLFDSHAHVNFEAFQNEWQTVLSACRLEGIQLTCVGSQLATSQRAVEIAESVDDGVYAAVGLHPTHAIGSTSHPEVFELDSYRALIRSSKKVVAIGETGIDFFHQPDNLKNQKTVFTQQVWLAKEHNLPIIIHGRNSRDGKLRAYEHILEVVKQEKVEHAVVHCFGDNWEMAQRFLELGFFIGITGIVTFPKADELIEIATKAPLEQVLIETDCPYLTPVPHRGEQNYPQYVRFVAEKIASLRGTTFDAVAEQTFANAKHLYRV